MNCNNLGDCEKKVVDVELQRISEETVSSVEHMLALTSVTLALPSVILPNYVRYELKSTCTRCKTSLPKSQFSKRQWKERQKSWGANCIDCTKKKVLEEQTRQRYEYDDDCEHAYIGGFMDLDCYEGHGDFGDH